MEFPDEALVRKTLEGDDSAFRTLVNRHCGVVHGLCYHLTQNFADAADLAQEAFIKAYFKLPSLSDPSRFLSWLRRITINVCHSWLSRQRNNTIPLEAIYEQADVSSSPVEIYEAKELQEKVAEAIKTLSEKNRQVITLYYLDGRSCEEVADFLDVSAKIVRSRLYEARKKLRKGLTVMVEEDLESNKLSQDFEEKVLRSIERAKEARSQRAYHEVITYCDEALDTLTKLPDSPEHKNMKTEALWLKFGAIDKQVSKEDRTKHYEEALEAEKEKGDKTIQAFLMERLARYCSEEEAVEYYGRALDIYSEIGDKSNQGWVLYFLAGRLANHSLEEGISHFQRAFDLLMEVGENSKWGVASHAAVNLLKHADRPLAELSFKGEMPLFGLIFWGYVCQTFEKSSGTVVYHGSTGTQGSFVRSGRYKDYSWTNKDEVKDTFKATPFRFLPGMTKILDASFSVGDSWSTEVPFGGDPMRMTVTIQSDSETVSVPAGEFSNCLKTMLVTSEEPEDCEESRCGNREFTYAPGVGLVKSVFVRRDGNIGVAQLTSYEVSDGKGDYFPLALGNKWTYEWADKDGVFPTTDVYEVIEAKNDQYNISHYYHALKPGTVVKIESDKQRKAV